MRSGLHSMESPSAPLTPEQAEYLRVDNRMRALFATARNSSLELSDPHVTLLDVFGGISSEKWTFTEENDEEARIPKLLGHWRSPPSSAGRRCVVASQREFDDNFAQFTSNVLSGLDWSNVFVAGGAILSCCLADRTSSSHYSSSDIDIFIYGLNLDEANRKLRHIHSIITANSTGCEVIRTKRTVTFLNSYPYRHVQVILRLYKSPAEILLGFDIDCCTFGYDGETTWTTQRGLRAITKGYNLVDATRRSASYEARLVKYARRGFAVMVPGLDKTRVHWEALVSKLPWEAKGLAKLLLYDLRYNALGPVVDDGRDVESDYDPEITIPWGPGWSAGAVLQRLNAQDKAHIFSSAVHSPSSSPAGPPPEHLFRTGFDLSNVVWSTDCPAYQDIDHDFQRLITGSFHPMFDGHWDDDVYLPSGDSSGAAAFSYGQATTAVVHQHKASKAARGRPSSLSAFAKAAMSPKRSFIAGAFRPPSSKPTRTPVHIPSQRLETVTASSGTAAAAAATTTTTSTLPPAFTGTASTIAEVDRYRLQPQRTPPMHAPIPTGGSTGAFSCNVCDDSFYSQNQLRRHVRTSGHVASAAITNVSLATSPSMGSSPVGGGGASSLASKGSIIEGATSATPSDEALIAALDSLKVSDNFTKAFTLFAICARKGLITSSEKTTLKMLYLKDRSIIDATINVYVLDGNLADMCDTWKRLLLAHERRV